MAVGAPNQPRTHVATGTHKDFGSQGVTGSPATLCQQRSVRLSRAPPEFTDTQGYARIRRIQILPPFLRSDISRPRAPASVLSSPRLPRSLRPPDTADPPGSGCSWLSSDLTCTGPTSLVGDGSARSLPSLGCVGATFCRQHGPPRRNAGEPQTGPGLASSRAMCTGQSQRPVQRSLTCL